MKIYLRTNFDIVPVFNFNAITNVVENHQKRQQFIDIIRFFSAARSFRKEYKQLSPQCNIHLYVNAAPAFSDKVISKRKQNFNSKLLLIAVGRTNAIYSMQQEPQFCKSNIIRFRSLGVILRNTLHTVSVNFVSNWITHNCNCVHAS